MFPRTVFPLLLALGPGAVTACAPRSTTDLDAVRSVLKRQVVAWNSGDLDGFLEGYWNSPRVVFQSGGDRSEGWTAMRDRYRRNYLDEGKSMGTLSFDKVEIEPLSPDTALARGRWTLTQADGTRPTGLFTLILKRLPDGWRIIHDHTSVATNPAKPSA